MRVPRSPFGVDGEARPSASHMRTAKHTTNVSSLGTHVNIEFRGDRPSWCRSEGSSIADHHKVRLLVTEPDATTETSAVPAALRGRATIHATCLFIIHLFRLCPLDIHAYQLRICCTLPLTPHYYTPVWITHQRLPVSAAHEPLPTSSLLSTPFCPLFFPPCASTAQSRAE